MDRVQIALKRSSGALLSDVVIGDAVVPAIRVQRIGKRVLLFFFGGVSNSQAALPVRVCGCGGYQRSGSACSTIFRTKEIEFRAERWESPSHLLQRSHPAAIHFVYDRLRCPLQNCRPSMVRRADGERFRLPVPAALRAPVAVAWFPRGCRSFPHPTLSVYWWSVSVAPSCRWIGTG